MATRFSDEFWTQLQLRGDAAEHLPAAPLLSTTLNVVRLPAPCAVVSAIRMALARRLRYLQGVDRRVLPCHVAGA